MPQFLITAPDGKKYKITGADKAGALAALQKHLGAGGGSAPGAPPNVPYAPPEEFYNAADLQQDIEKRKAGIKNPYSPALQGATFNASDEILSTGMAPVMSLTNLIRGEGETSLVKNWERMQTQQAREKARSDRENPEYNTVAGLGGAFMTGGPGYKWAMSAPSLAGKSGKSGVVTSAYGALSGFLGGDTMDERVSDAQAGAATGFGIGAAIPGLGNLIGKGYNSLTKMFGGQNTSDAIQDFAQAGVRPTPGAVTGGRGVQIVEQALANTPGGAGTMARVSELQADDLVRAKDAIVSRMGTAKTPQSAGESIRDATKNATKRFKKNQEFMYGEAFKRIGADTKVDMPNSIRLFGDFLLQQRAAAGARDDVLTPIINRAGKIFEASGDIQFDAVRKLRTDIGRMIDTPPQGMSEGAQQDQLRALYGALTADIKAAAQKAGPQAAKILDIADRYTRFNLTVNQPLWQKIADLGADEAAYVYALQGADKGGSRLAKLRKNFKPDEWDTVSATVFDRLGLATPGQRGAQELGGAEADFSLNTFLTNWNKLSPEAKQQLFGSKRYAPLKDEIDRFIRVVTRAKDVQRMYNPSGTARNVFAGSALALAGSQAAVGDLAGAGATLVGTMVAPYVTAKMMASPLFIKWLSSFSASGASGSQGIQNALMRLNSVAAFDPSIRGEVKALQAELMAKINQPSKANSP